MRFHLTACNLILFQFNFFPISISSSLFYSYSIFMLFIRFFPPSIKFLPISIACLSRFYSFPVPISLAPFPLPQLKFLPISLASPSRFLPPFPPPHACDSSFTQFQLSRQACNFFLAIPPLHLRFLFTYCRLKQSPCPKFLQHSSVFTLSTPVLISQSDLFSTPLNEVLH